MLDSKELMEIRPEDVGTLSDLSTKTLTEMGGGQLAGEGDRRAEDIEDGVPEETTVYDDGEMLRLNYLYKDNHLILHSWRGHLVPDHYWGQGHFGIALQNALRHVFPVDTFGIDYVAEMLSYFAVLEDAGHRIPPIPEARIKKVADVMVATLKRELASAAR